MYPIAHQVHRNGNTHFPDHLQLLPKLISDAGYHTGLIGKLHLSRSQSLKEVRPDDGYDEFYWSPFPFLACSEKQDYHDWIEEKGGNVKDLLGNAEMICGAGIPTKYHQTTWAEERAKNFISRNTNRPWFLSMNIFDPHPPFDPPEEYLRQFDPVEMPGAKFRLSDIDHQKRFQAVDQQARKAVIPDDFPIHQSERHDFLEFVVDHAGASHDTPPQRYNVKEIRAAYNAMISLIDDMLGSIISVLEETNQRDNTLIIFMSDHGEMLGDHGLIYKGCRFYDGLVRVPLIFSAPGKIQASSPSNALVELIDIAPTLLDLIDVPIPSQMQGVSLAQLLRGEKDRDSHKNYVISEYFDSLRFPGSQGSRGNMYFDGRYKLNMYHDIGEGELFDTKTDPDEYDDLWHSDDHAALKSDLITKSFAAMMRASGAGPARSADY